jgi:putative flippase GtrA
VFKQIISRLFILGTLLHSGVLYLVVMFDQYWAVAILQSGVGPFMILAGLAAIGVAAIIGFRSEPVKE